MPPSSTSSLLRPDPEDPKLTQPVRGIDEQGQAIETRVVMERPLTLFLNGQEIVTMMTIGDYPEYLAVGYLLNQNMLRADDEITGIDVDAELEVVVVRTARATNYEEKLKKKIRTSGCAPGHGLRRPDGALRRGAPQPAGAVAHLRALRPDPKNQRRAQPST